MSIPAMLSVNEGSEVVQLCATLSALEPIERSITITLATSDDTGIIYYIYYIK